MDAMPPLTRVRAFSRLRVPSFRRVLLVITLMLIGACTSPPAPPAALPSVPRGSITPTSSAVPALPTRAETPSPVAVIDESQLLPSGLRIEEHPLRQRPELEPLAFTALDGQSEVMLLRRHASALRQSLRPESYYAVCHCTLRVSQGAERLETAYIGKPDLVGNATVAVTRNGNVIFSTANASPGVTSEFRVLAVYDERWVLELAQRLKNPDSSAFFSGRVFVDGVSLNDKYGYQESFGFQ